MAGRMFDISEVNSVWLGMWRGMRAYGVAIAVIWTMSTTSVLAVFAIAANGLWLKAALGGGAILELVCCWLTLAFLIRASNSGRFDT